MSGSKENDYKFMYFNPSYWKCIPDKLDIHLKNTMIW